MCIEGMCVRIEEGLCVCVGIEREWVYVCGEEKWGDGGMFMWRKKGAVYVCREGVHMCREHVHHSLETGK